VNFVLINVAPPQVDSRPEHFPWKLFLASLDDSLTIPLTDPRGQVLLQRGFLGLGVPPVDIAIAATPGVAGGLIQDVQVITREPVLPVKVWGKSESHKMEAIQQLRDLTDPEVGMTRDGNFKIVCETPGGVRELTVAYRSGLEGDNHGLAASELFVLGMVAADPYARDRDPIAREFTLGGLAEPFLAVAGTDHPWPRALAPSTVIGEDMQVDMASAVKVFPTISLTGPSDSALITSDTGLRIEVPAPLLTGQTLRVATSPRSRSIRLNGAPAAGRLSLASRLVPFQRGMNMLDVEVPGATSATKLSIEWHGGHRSMW